MFEKEKEYGFLVEIIYKSGAKIRYWFKEFDMNYKGKATTAEWNTVSDFANPLLLGLDDISSIHQLSTKEIKKIKDPLDTRMDWEK